MLFPFSAVQDLLPVLFAVLILSQKIGFSLCTSNSSNLTSNLEQDRIYNGETVEAGKWPFMVALLFNTGMGYTQFCGGSIINDDSILTATHCAWVDSDRSAQNLTVLPSDVFVYVGHINLKTLNRNYLYAVKEFIVNPVMAATRHLVKNSLTGEEEYQLDFSQGHDAAVIKLEKKITFEEGLVTPVCLPHPKAVVIREQCIVMGWGTREDGSHPNALYQVEIPIMDGGSSCGSSSAWDRAQLICAGNPKYQKDACQGDSGGPFICPHQSEPKEYLQFGIVSYGVGCGQYGGFYQNTTAVLDWIKEQAEK